jgi:hypothetical protein
MNETFCNYPGKRDETIVAYLYGEMESDERAAFDRHLVACAPCRAELVDLRDVRSELARWASPEPIHMPFNVEIPRQPAVVARARNIPVWAQAIAATVVLGAAAGVANLDVSYSQAAGLSIRTGWRHPVEVTSSQAQAIPASSAQGSASVAPWTADLAALEREMRGALDQRPATTTIASSSGSDEALLRRVRQLVQDSERRQESELALKVAEVAREVQAQRQADLIKIDRTLGLMQSRTGIEVMRTQRQVNSLAQQVSQRP